MIKNQYLLVGLVALGVLELVVIVSLLRSERDTARDLAKAREEHKQAITRMHDEHKQAITQVREEHKQAIAQAREDQKQAAEKIWKEITALQQEAKEAREWAAQTDTDLKKARKDLDQMDERVKKGATSPAGSGGKP